MSNEYQSLDLRIQKWIFKQGWSDLREIQKKAIPPILSEDRDVLISASTAAGKTEAFFLPACSTIANQFEGFGILYISPLKALINDQYRRLESLCNMLDMDVTPWHGDSSQSRKRKVKESPSGILLITPESLESLMIREAGWVRHAFSSLRYIVIDEFHAFIGTERGQHLLSLLNRLEHVLNQSENPIPRVALSATLGELENVPQLLRPNKSLPCETITSSKSQSTMKLEVRGYIDPLDIHKDETLIPAEYRICQELFEICRGGSHLVFANSRKRTESIAARLGDFCERDVVPNEFFPHHGSLSKELRESLESRLQKETLPTTAVCTMTLELGIDIGKVNSVVQVTAPHSVSSLRQRLGRSGRRGSPAILRMLIAEKELDANANIIDKLRLELIQSIAMIRLLLVDKWYEPADTSQMHLSTFLHQILAVIAQWGSIRVDQLYVLLCKSGVFPKIEVHHLKDLLTHMGKIELLQQLSSGELVLGIQGERLVSSYTFYSVFKTPEEFRIVTGSKTLGTLPVDSLVMKEQHIIFGGKRWKIIEIDEEKKVIHVKATKGGKPPEFGQSGGMSIHDLVRQEMLKIYMEGDYRIPIGDRKNDFIDETARKLFQEGVSFFCDSDLSSNPIVQQGKNVYIFTWLGDKAVNTLTVILIKKGFKASKFSGVIEVRDTTTEAIEKSLRIVLNDGVYDDLELASIIPVEHKNIEKYDEFLPENLLSEGYGRRAFNSSGIKNWLNEHI
ncbi:MAG: DEAD/DEAH box helicase [Proteobacteria bacterium]|nr:DEAD/DEAH box helicase [Pseudomonadota bacterium]